MGAKRSLADCQEPGQNSGGGGLVDPQADNGALERDMVQSSPSGRKQTRGEIPLKKERQQTKIIITLRDDRKTSCYVEKIMKNAQHERSFYLAAKFRELYGVKSEF